MSQRKLIFFAVIAGIVLIVGAGLTILSNSKTETGPKGPKELSVWVVGDDVAGYKDIVDSFKKSDGRYKNTEVRVTKFADYSDYEKTLLNVIADGNSPDVFMVSSDGAGVLENKIQPIPSSLISSEAFSRNFNRIFDPLLVEKKEKDEEGKERIVSELRGIPMGYETMGAFYNLDLVPSSVPATWKEFSEKTPPSNSSEESTGETDNASPSGVFAGIGLSGRYVPNAGDIVALFLVQNGIESFMNLGDAGAIKAVSDYAAFAASEEFPVSGVTANGNGLSLLKAQMDRLSINAADLFARGKIGVVFGYPSLLREIQYAIKRASQENVLNKRNFKATSIPVVNTEKPINLATYRYFAASRYSNNSDAALDFLVFLATKPAQESYLEKFSYYLPALNELVDVRKNQVIDKEFPRVKYESFFPADSMRAISFDRGFPAEYRNFFDTSNVLDTSPKAALTAINDSLRCLYRHLVEGANFEESCRK